MHYLYGFVCLVAGVSLGGLGWWSGWWYGLAGATCLAWLITFRSRKCRVLVLAFGLACMLGGRMSQSLPESSFKVADFSRQELLFEGVVKTQPKQSLKSLQVRLDEVRLVNRSEQWQGAIQLSLPVHSQVLYGDRLKVAGQIQDVEELDDGYENYLKNRQVYGVMVWPDIVERAAAESRDVVGWGIWIQEQTAKRVERLLPQDMAAFLVGIVLGADRVVSEGFDQALRDTGTSHIVVASGYNVGILVALAIKLCSGWGKYWSSGLATLMVVGFVFVSGLEASLIRASLMSMLALLAVLWGRQKQALYFLLIAAVIMLAINPWWMYDTGFQLSFMATLSLIMFQPTVAKLTDKWLASWLSEIVSSTIAAQILVVPVLWLTFGTFSLVSLLSNVLVLWLIPWLMLVGWLLMVCCWTVGWLAQTLAFGLYPWLWYVKEVILGMSRWPAASVEVEVSGWLVGLYYIGWMAVYSRISNYEQTS